jgi:hypothetical protein
MKPFLKLLLSFILLLPTISQRGEAADRVPAFPGAEGYGRYTTGGRGGAVYHVTSLADDGKEGTLRWAIQKKGKRTIVFDVSGTIFLTSALAIRNGDITIAGQSAPGDGICVADYPFTLNADNIIIRYIRFRLGNRHVAEHEGDGLGGMDRKNIIIDHCSVSWSIDECLSVYGSTNITVQWCIADQSLVAAGHSKGNHGYGGNWGGSGASYHHNLLAHHSSRVPRLGPRPSTQLDERMDLRNNVFYNWAGNGCYGGEAMHVNIVNNYYKPGPATDKRNATIRRRIASVNIRTTSYCDRKVDEAGNVTGNAWLPTWHVWGKYYLSGNVNPDFDDVTADNWTYGFYNQIDVSGNDGTYTEETRDTIRLTSPIPFELTTTHSAEHAYLKVLDFAGASLHRDSHDQQIVNDTRNRSASFTGKDCYPGLINTQDDNRPADADADWSAWPVLNSEIPNPDRDRDGMPDDWESLMQLDPDYPSDGAMLSSNGYTNLENYLNMLVEEITFAQNIHGIPMEGNQESSIECQSFEVSSPIYSIDGRLVAPNALGDDLTSLAKGFYIYKGKGILIR